MTRSLLSHWKATSYYFKNIPDGLTSLSENRIKFVEILKAQPSSSSQSVWSCKVIEIKDETCQDLSESYLTYFADLEVSQLVGVWRGKSHKLSSWLVSHWEISSSTFCDISITASDDLSSDWVIISNEKIYDNLLG